MKTITMDFSEYERLVDEKNEALKDLNYYIKAVQTVYGDEISANLRNQALAIEDAREAQNIRRLVHEGKI